MSRMYDTKGSSLRSLLDGLDYQNLCDIREIAAYLEEAAPGSLATERTRRVIALAEAAIQAADDDMLRNVWAGIAFNIQNGLEPIESARDVLRDTPLAQPGSPAVTAASRLVAESKTRTLLLIADLDALLVSKRA